MNPELQTMFRAAVLQFVGHRERLRQMHSQWPDDYTRAVFKAMPPVAQCQEMLLRARHAAAAGPRRRG